MFQVGGQPDNCRFFSRVPPSPSIAEEERHVFTPIPQPARKFLTLGRTCTALECGEGHRRCDRHRERIVSLAVDQGSQEQSKAVAVDGCVTHPDTRDNSQSDGTDSSRIATPCSYSDGSASDCSCSDCDPDSYCDLGTYYNLAPDCDFRRFATARCLIVKSLPRFDDTVATGQDHTEGQSQSPQRSAQTAPEDHNGPDVTATVGKKVSDIPDSESPLTE